MIDAWREAAIENPAFYIGWGGLLIGAIFGFIVQRTNFCTMGSLSDYMNFGDLKRFRSWVLATAVAIIGVYWMDSTGIANFGDSSAVMYVTSNLAWGGHLIGGLIFGIGMVFSGGCVSRNLVRAGSGDLRALIVLIFIGLAAYITIGGLLGPLRANVLAATTTELGVADQRIGTILASLTGMSASTGYMVAVIVIAGGIIVWSFMDKGFRTSPTHVIAGVGIGLCVVAGWFLTAIAFDEFADNPTLASLSYVRPAGDTIDYFMRFTAFGAPSFAVTITGGALIGSFIAAITQKKFHLATFSDAGDTLRNLGGAILMGIGGVVALGCTVGQAVTGFSTLAVGSLITFIAIIIGGIIGLKTMEAMA